MTTVESNIKVYPENSVKQDLIFVDHEDQEFKRMFDYFPDQVMENKIYREVLQYMGTVIERNKLTGNILQIYHEFRHRALPETNERKYWKLLASNFFVFDYVTRLEDF